MAATQVSEIKAVIDDSTRQYWDDSNGKPLLLSQIGPILAGKFSDYQETIKPLRLKQFIELNLADRLKLVVHPAQPEKIGLIPANKSFRFESSELADPKKGTGRYRLHPEVWGAFTTRPEANMCRYIVRDGDGHRRVDLPASSAPPGDAVPVANEFIITDFTGASKQASDTFKSFERWIAKNHLDIEDYTIPMSPPTGRGRSTQHGTDFSFSSRKAEQFFSTMARLSEQDLRETHIPLHVLLKLVGE